VPTTLGVAAAAGVGLVVFSEAETALQLLGSAALVQLFVKKFLFADVRPLCISQYVSHLI
jgi:chitinase domain-containing protein 1